MYNVPPPTVLWNLVPIEYQWESRIYHPGLLPSKVVVGRLQHARMVPDDQSSQPKQDPNGGRGGSWILDQLNLEGLNSWTWEQQQSAMDLLVDSADVFAKTDLDLGKCNIIKHAIKITDPQPFKECYRRIPPLLEPGLESTVGEGTCTLAGSCVQF